MDTLAAVKNGGVVEIVLTTTPFAKLILLILLVFSIVSWAIIIRKWLFFRNVQQANRAYVRRFEQRSSLVQFAPTAAASSPSALPEILAAALLEWQRLPARQSDAPAKMGTLPAFASKTGGVPNFLAAAEAAMPMIKETMERRISVEAERYESSLSFLATAGSSSPFLGLLGTVWGIMKSFMDIRGLASVNVQTVAPGIADALVVTAAGLLVAVPAVIFYNHFTGRIRDLVAALERFSSEVASDLRREFLKAHAARSD